MDDSKRYTTLMYFPNDNENEYPYHYYPTRRAIDCKNLEIYTILGHYEDLGYTPTELADILINHEVSKGVNNWNLEKIEQLEVLKERIKHTLPKENKEL